MEDLHDEVGECPIGEGSTGNGQSSYTVQALDNALSLLVLIGDAPDLGLSELSRRLGAGKARIYRQLKTLEERGFVSCSEPNRTYRLGLAALMLGAKASGQIDIVSITKPFLARLGERLQETIQLRVLDGDETVCIASWEPVRDLRVHGLIGRRRPLHAGSSKVILAYIPELEQNRLISKKLVRFTEKTIVDEAHLRAALRQIVRDGFGVSRGEINTDLMSVTAPIFKLGGAIAGAINVAAPASRMSAKQLSLTMKHVKSAADEITAAIGGLKTTMPPI